MKKIWVLIFLLIVSLYSVEALNIPSPPPAPGQDSGSSAQESNTGQTADSQESTTTTTIDDEQTNFPSSPSSIPSTTSAGINSAPVNVPVPTTTVSNAELTTCRAQLVQCQNDLTRAQTQTVFPARVEETKTGAVITFAIVVLIVALIISVWILHKKKEFSKREAREKIVDYVYLQMSKGYNRQAIYKALSSREDIDSNMLVDIFKEINSKVNKR